MLTPGQFSVSPTGAFTYKIPVAIPPGTGGMEPALSLDYSSQSGDGTLGWGWMLSGVPSIGRCPRTYAQEGVHGSVNYDANDRFCLEGQRLIAVSGPYGASGTVYRTELDGFSQITSFGVAGNGPSYFIVQTKSGQTMEFGNTPDSKVLAQGKATVRVWGLDKATDSKSNYLTVTYINDTINGQAYPIEIDYTGNTAAGLTPFSSVQFVYNMARLYPVPAYQAGSMVKTTVLLTDVKTFQGVASGGSATLVADYRLAYTAPASGAAHYELTSVTQCDAAAGGNCLTPATFGWQGSKDALTLTATANSVTQGGAIGPGSFQGSGLTDFVTSSVNSSCGLYFGTRGGFSYSSMQASFQEWINNEGMYTNVPYSGPLCKWNGFTGLKRYVDINGDGLTDVLLNQNVAANHPQTFQLLDSGTAINQTSYPPGYPLDPAVLYAGDFNGDGRTDILTGTGSGYSVDFSNGDGSFSAGATITTQAGIALGDFNGDGCTDVLEQGTSNQVILSCNPATPSFAVPNFSASQVVLGDFNGDGLTDMLVAPISGAATLYLSTGSGLATAITLGGFTDWGKYAIYAGDWNGDGKTDLLLVASGQSGFYGVGTSHKVYLSTGAGFNPGPTIANTNSLDTNVLATVADWNNDGADDIWLQKKSGDNEELFSYVPEAISTVTNGLGITTSVTYTTLNANGTLYQKCATAGTFVCGTAYPTLSLDGDLYVVSSVASSNAVGGSDSSSYAYEAAQSDLHGRGFLGFGQMTVTDNQTGVAHTTRYGTLFPFTGLITAQTVTAAGVTLSSSANTYLQVSLGAGTDGVARSVVELKTMSVASSDLDGSALPTVTTSYTYDCDTGGACAGAAPTGFGNTTVVAVSVSDGSSKKTTNRYANDTSNGHWYLGRLLGANTQSIVGASNLTRQTAYNYDTGAPGSTGLLLGEIVEPESASDPTLKLETDYAYDAFGNKTSSSSVGCTFAPTCVPTTRASQTQFDTATYHGQFATQSTNALGQAESWGYVGGVAFGVPTSHTGPNGLTTSWTYDTFGRKTLETRPDGNRTVTAYVYCAASACPVLPTGLTAAQLPANVRFYVLTTPQNSSGAQNGALSVSFYDGLSRLVATDVEGFDGAGSGCSSGSPCWIRAATLYDASGRPQETSRPFFVAGGAPRWTAHQYDALGRVTLTTFPDSSTLATRYCGLATSVTNALGQITTKVKTAEGQVAQVYEQAASPCGTTGSLTSYTYDAFADPLTVTDPAGNLVANSSYDIRGRRVRSLDADMGSWTYTYDGFGELYAQVDAKAQTSTFAYDALGRVTAKSEAGFVSFYAYDTAPGKGVGQPATATTGAGNSWGAFSWGAAAWTGSAYSRAFAYDAYGRPSGLTLTEDATAGAYGLSYDANGRLLTVAYPSGLSLRYAYTPLGYLQQITDSGSGAAYWTANARDAEMHLTSASAGSGVTTTHAFDPDTGLVQSILAGAGNGVSDQAFSFDTLGRLTSRSWLNTAGGVVKENSCFDGLNRLTSALVTSGTACTGAGAVSVTYDALGNVTSKSDVCATAGCFAYGGGGAGPHALTSIAGTFNGVANPTFGYDADGMMLFGAGRSITPTTFDMAASIASGNATAAFGYDPDHARYKMVASGLNAGTTYYLNDAASGAMEERVVVAGQTTWRDYLMADGRLIGQRQCTGPPPCSSGASMLYFVLDHLGSVTVATDAGGNVLQRLSYDAWGARRNADGSALSCLGGLSPPSGVSRGFTGEETIDALCLVNLNARLYDPALGRMTSADPVVGDATVPQELNRFSYVLNDPLSLTDPSGLCFLGCFWNNAVFRDVLALGMAIVFEQEELLPQLEGFAIGATVPTGLAFVNAGVIGGLSGLISSGGTLKGAALGALEADLFFEAGNVLQDATKSGYLGLGARADTFVAHGLVGGFASELRGGRFGAGFLSAGVASLAPVPTGQQTSEETAVGTAETAVLGGVGSILGGGKFQNGAITGAFGYLFNQLQHQVTQNRECHECAVAQEGLKYQAQGYIVTPNVSFIDQATGLKVIVDLVISAPDFPLPTPELLIDVKTGNGGLTRNQSIVYPKLESGTIAIPVGLNALAAGFIPGIPTQVQMKVDIPRYPGVKGPGN